MGENQLLELTGSVEQVIYRNEKNGYTVLSLLAGDGEVTAVGTLPWVNAGETLRLVGEWKTHPNFGTQFAAVACERFQPAGEGAILRYLSSGAVKGIGPVMAARLVDAFGDQTLEVLENHPERLASVKGISKAKAQQIASELHNLSGIQEVMSYLGAFGISPEEALQIWKVWGDAAVEMIRMDPYVLCREPVSIDFERVDAIAASLERPHDERGRIRAGISYVLLHNMNNGHTCLPKDRLLPAAASYLEIEEELADEILYEMIQDLTLELDLINGREFIFTPKMHQCEIYIAARMLMMLNFPAQSITGVEEAVAAIEAQSGIQYAQQQKQAITEALSKGMLILTGGPGTGKTTTLNGILNILEQNGERVYLAAPTGRAAQRMSEVTRREAKTIHRLLEVEWDPQDRPVFTRNEKNMLDCDTLILDELSMVDNALFEGVLRALPLGCRLILVGDTDQLPSVGPGNVLGDLIASGLLPVVQLTEIFRQSMQSLIVTNAHQIVQGQMPELGRKDGDFFFLPNQDPVSIRDTIVDLCLRRLPASYGYSPGFDIQVLSPGRKGELGTIALNQSLQSAVNPPEKGIKKEITVNGVLLREGDKVMQVKNNYNSPWEKDDGTLGEGVYNGDVGILLEVDRTGSAAVRYDDKVAAYDLESIGDLELAYAVTVHKSQGSEFEAVVMPMYPGPRQLYYRNLLYTGVTRAKNLLVMVGTPKTVERMVENNRKTKRYTGLCYFLLRAAEEAE